MQRRMISMVVALLAALVVVVPASQATDGVGDEVVAPGGLLVVEVVESNSDLVNEIYLGRPWGWRYIADDDDWGAVRLFVARPGATLQFGIRVTDGGTPTGDRFVTGSQNARVTEPTPGCILVEFEDKAPPWEDPDEPNYVDARFFVRRLFHPPCGPSPAP